MPPMVNRVGSVSPGWRLDVVMPAYNERGWVVRAVTAVATSATEAGCAVRVLVVDDGSDDQESRQVLEELATRPDVFLVRQANAGRFAARIAGLEHVETDHVLLLDARVEVDPSALSRIRTAVEKGADVWNFDVTPGSHGLGALFWSGITKVWWRDYFRGRHPVSFGIADFDRYPTGTGAFFGPTQLLRDAMGGFDSHFSDRALASDDTRMLRNVASAADINLSPDVMCRHHVKTGRGSFVRQCYYRGTTFVDGYLSDSAKAGALLRGSAFAGAAAGYLTWRAPRASAGGAVAGCLAAGFVTRSSGGTARESVAVALMSPVFGLFFGAGVLRGLRLAATSRG